MTAALQLPQGLQFHHWSSSMPQFDVPREITLSNIIASRTQDDKDVKKKSMKCTLQNCYLCTHGTKEFQTELYQKGWHRRIVPVFIFLEKSNGRVWQHLINDIFPFVQEHWDALWPCGHTETPADKSWKESIKALISRKKHLFESGKKVYGTRGYWRLAESIERPSTPLERSDSNDTKKQPEEDKNVTRSPENTAAATYTFSIPKKPAPNTTNVTATPSRTLHSQAYYLALPALPNRRLSLGEVQPMEAQPSKEVPPIGMTSLPQLPIDCVKIDSTLSKDFPKFLSRQGIK